MILMGLRQLIFLRLKKLNIELIIIPILLIAAFLRLQSLWYIEFKADEAASSFLAYNLVYKGIFPLTGDVSSIGVYNPPIFIYLLTIPFIFSKNPAVASGFVALLNVMAVYLCYLFCNKFFNKRVALIASAFFAVNPWAILYSRKIWANNLLTLFILLFFYSLYEIVINGKQKYIFLTFISFAVFTQLHFSTFYFAALWLIISIIFKPKIKLKYLLFGIGILALFYLPYILFELRNNFYNLNLLLEFSKIPIRFWGERLAIPFRFATAWHFPGSSPAADIFQKILLGGAISYLIYKLKNKKYSILLLWFILPVLFLTIGKTPPQAHYFIALFPVQFIMTGILLDKIFGSVKRSCYLITLILILLLTQAFASFKFFNKTIRENRNIYLFAYGPPFKYRYEEIKQVMSAGFTGAEEIHRELLNKGNSIFKYDFLATQYIVNNLVSISK